ncbi:MULTISPECIES: hypothetical protein [Haloarcula]|uniref:hypothetical protein n=1 Tax=Haloarcula TaxID=2237 RepID=UPI0023E7AEDC|nr:hypothetical protein [Halomicroarcula sp. SHR3]
MVHCPGCGTTLEDETDIEFTDRDSTIGIINSSKRFYTASCAACGRTIGSGVAGARGNAGAA